MCGFLFEFSVKQSLQVGIFQKILKRSVRRGPDYTGYWTNNTTVQMGFNRLAILELTEAGYQPMHSPRGRYVLVFNGEIYNHLDLRKQLSFNQFKGHSDTETLTVCFEEWGIRKTVEALDGMFALVVYDQQTGTTTLARDFAGIKPLFYGWNGTTLVAASQYDQVVMHPAFVNEPMDASVLKLYVQQHFLPAPFGLYRHTYQVNPGEVVEVTQTGVLSKHQYWSFPEWYQPTVYEQKQALDNIHQALATSVEAEMLSDVPLGAFLSGGIDSPLVCYYASKLHPALKTFTIGSDSAVHDESERAATFAQLLGTAHHTEKMVAGNAHDIWNEVMNCQHEPMADFSIIPTYLVSKLARKHVTVALSGDGGDELFFGYERFWSVAKNIRYQQWPWLLKAGMYKADKWLSRNKRINSAVLFPTQARAHQGLHSRFSKQIEQSLFPDLHLVSLPVEYTTYDYPIQDSLPHLLQHMRKSEFYGMMQKTLRKVDLASMENSLEVRVPFLKKSLMEASLKLDPFLSYAPGKKKAILKQLVSRVIPGAPIDEVKRGFSVPLSKWFRQDLWDVVSDTLQQKDWLHHFGINKSGVDRLLAEHQQGEDYKWPIFTLIALTAWRKSLNP
jgi:asparagine synthase (glutamine-hydrolysing)